MHGSTGAYFAGQRVAVGVETARRDPDQRVTFADALRSEDFLAVHDPDEESGQVVRLRGVHAGHRGRFAAEERRVRPRAGIGHRADDAREYVWIDLRGREVIQEEERLGAHGERVVHAVIDEIGADDLVTVEESRDLELRADAVRRCDKDLVRAGRREEPAELPYLADHLGPPRARDAVLDPAQRVLRARDVHAGIAVRDAHAFTGSASSESFASSSCTGTR